jgi:ATP-dependent helicase/nuclease subunit B
MNQGHLFTINASQPFLPTLAAGLKARYGETELSAARIFLPTRRAAQGLRDAFLPKGGDAEFAALLPRIATLADVDEGELLLTGDAELAKAVAGLPPALSAARRRFLLMPLIRARRDIELSAAQAYQLADDLGRLIDQSIIMSVDLATLETLVPDALAAHWQHSREFLQIIYQHWPEILKSEGAIDAIDRRQRLMSLAIARWQQSAPQTPVIAAGSTASQPVTRDWLAAIKDLPQGSVVLPGLDMHLEEEAWSALEATHPQFHMAQFLKHCGAGREDVAQWQAGGHNEAREKFLSEVMRPAAFANRWRHLRHDDLGGLAHGMELIEAASEQQEAVAAALMIREALETPEKTVALVTPDRKMAARVAALMDRWGVGVDDSGGQSLAATPVGSFVFLFTSLLREATPSSLMAFFKHPFAGGGFERGTFLEKARLFERDFFRQQPSGRNFAQWLLILGEAQEKVPNADFFSGIIKKIMALQTAREMPLAEMLIAIFEALEAMQAKDVSLWEGPNGEALAALLEEMRVAAQGMKVGFYDALAILEEALRRAPVRRPYGYHPRFFILGLLEARLLAFDHVILSGLNENIWPELESPDPWLSRGMRLGIGLPTHEQYVGLMAHDFVQMAASPSVTLLRCERTGEAPSQPSRWLLCLQAVLQKAGTPDALWARQPWLEWASQLDRASELSPCEPPAVKIALEAWPASIGLYDLETLIRDPYAFYARKILRLKALDALDAEMDARMRGNIIHRALYELLQKYPRHWPPEAQVDFIGLMQEAYRDFGLSDAEMDIINAQLPKLAAAFYDFEREQRKKITASHLERESAWKLNINGRVLTLKARADRLDMLRDGTLEIIDYKTGAVPSKKDVAAALKPQMIVETLMAEAGAFKDMDAKPVSALTYVSVGENKGEVEASKAGVEPQDIRAVHVPGLSAFLQAFMSAAAVFHAAPRPQLIKPAEDYARLARVSEWSKGSLPQEDGEL